SNGFPLEDDPRGFEPDAGQPRPFYTDSNFGRSIAMSFDTGRPMIACGDHLCQMFFQTSDTFSFHWYQTGSGPAGDTAGVSEIGSLAIHAPNNTISIFNSSSPPSYDNQPQATFVSPTVGGVFTGGILGDYDQFLVGVSVPNVGTQFFAYA